MLCGKLHILPIFIDSEAELSDFVTYKMRCFSGISLACTGGPGPNQETLLVFYIFSCSVDFYPVGIILGAVQRGENMGDFCLS
jgi:hypothetical protein